MGIIKRLKWKDKTGKTTDYDLGAKASNVEQDATHRFVSDTEKQTWNGKADPEDIPSGSAADYGVANNDTTNRTDMLVTAQVAYQHGKEIDQLNSEIQNLQEGIMKIATKTVTLTTGQAMTPYQNIIDLTDIGLDPSKIIACYVEILDIAYIVSTTARGGYNLTKSYDTVTGKLTVEIDASQYANTTNWTATIIAVTA